MLTDAILNLKPNIESFWFSPQEHVDVGGPTFFFGPDELAAYGAKLTYKSRTPIEEFKRQVSKESARAVEHDAIIHGVKAKEDAILADSVGRGHASISDVPTCTFILKNVPRTFSLQICAYVFMNPLQESGRRTLSRGFCIPEQISENATWAPKVEEAVLTTTDTYTKIFEELYHRILAHISRKHEPKIAEEKANGRALEIARGVLPLFQVTNMICQSSLEGFVQFVREMNQAESPSTIKSVCGEILSKIREAAPLLTKWALEADSLKFYPAPQFYSDESSFRDITQRLESVSEPVLIDHQDSLGSVITPQWLDEAVASRDKDRLNLLKTAKSFLFLKCVPIYVAHQDIRHRTIETHCESLYACADRATFHNPSEIRSSSLNEEYQKTVRMLFNLYKEMVSSGIARSEAIGIIPQCTNMHLLTRINGWNSIHYFSERLCVPKAQPEIRLPAYSMARQIKETDSTLGKYAEPKCVPLGFCPEKYPCGYYEKWLEKDEREKKRILLEDI